MVLSGNIKSGVKIFNVTGSLDATTINETIGEFIVDSGSSSISAGTFVNYINRGFSESKNVSTQSYSGSRDIAAVRLSDTSVFVMHGAGSGSTCYVYGVVVTISGNTITVGADTRITDTTYSGTAFTCVALDSTRVLTLFKRTNSSYLNGIVCTINGTTITPGTNTQISTTSNTAINIVAKLVSTNKVIVIYGSNPIYGIVLTISGSTITNGTQTTIFKTAFNAAPKLEVLSSSSVLMVYSSYQNADSAYNNGYQMSAMVLTISNTTITTNTSYLIDSDYGSYLNVGMCAMGDNKFLLIHSNKYVSQWTTDYEQVDIIKVSGTTVTVVKTGTLNEWSNFDGTESTGETLWANNVPIKIKGNRYGVFHYNQGRSTLSKEMCYTEMLVTDTYIRKLGTIEKFGYDSTSVYVHPFLLTNGNILVIYGIGSGANATINGLIKYTGAVTAADTPCVAGIAKESGSAGSLIDVYTP